jgi:hypothetical protein
MSIKALRSTAWGRLSRLERWYVVNTSLPGDVELNKHLTVPLSSDVPDTFATVNLILFYNTP